MLKDRKQENVLTAGIISSIKKIITKNNENMLFVKIINVGSRDCFIECLKEGSLKREEYVEKYKKEYDFFLKGKNPYIGDGFPLAQWAFIDKATAKNLEYYNIYTVEQLSSVPDSARAQLPMGMKGLIKKAQDFLQGESFMG
jgi:hypothetical protein